MQRAIVTPPVLASDALAELKDWLAITTDRDDGPLTSLILAGLEMCEAFTRQMPLECTCEEVLKPGADWQRLMTVPVQTIEGVEAIAADGSRQPLPASAYAVTLDPDGGGRIRITAVAGDGRVAVRFSAGMAAGWNGLPIGIRHGIIRLAAHHYRQRDPDGTSASPPAAVAALWQPWRRLRIT